MQYHFWFRLAENLQLYYASNKSEFNVLGSLSIQKIVSLKSKDTSLYNDCGEQYCFELEDTINSNWTLCSLTFQEMRGWYCTIKKQLNTTKK